MTHIRSTPGERALAVVLALLLALMLAVVGSCQDRPAYAQAGLEERND
jgi:hypothetical protein